MKSALAICMALALCGGSHAADHVGSLEGGGLATNSTCAMDLAIGGLGGCATAPVPPVSMKQGFVGQLADPVGFHLAAPARSVNSSNAIPLGGAIELDDGTVLAVIGSDIVWSPAGFPLISIAPDGTALAASVDHDVATVVTGAYHGTLFTMPFYVLDTTPGHFDIVSITNRSTNMSLYLPSSAIRTYTLESTMDLKTGAWSAVSGQTGRSGDGSILAMSDTNNQARARMYRVRIFPP